MDSYVLENTSLRTMNRSRHFLNIPSDDELEQLAKKDTSFCFCTYCQCDVFRYRTILFNCTHRICVDCARNMQHPICAECRTDITLDLYNKTVTSSIDEEQKRLKRIDDNFQRDLERAIELSNDVKADSLESDDDEIVCFNQIIK